MDLIPEQRSFARDLDNLFVESGRRAHVIWRLDGSYGGLRAVSKEIVNPPGGGTEGIWAEPLRLADYVHFHLWCPAHGLESVERSAKRYTRHVGWSEIFYQFGTHPEMEITKRVWAPREHPAVVVDVAIRNTTDRAVTARLFTVFQSHLSVGWPLREGGANLARFDDALPGVVATEVTHPGWAATCAVSLPVAAAHLGDFRDAMIDGGGLVGPRGGTTGPSRGRSAMEHHLEIPADGSVSLTVVVAGSTGGVAEACATARAILARRDELYAERLEHYGRLFAGTTTLESPSYVMDKAFLWAKVGTEDFKHDDPELGFLFFAGYPAYNFYFASDTMLILRGSLAAGDFEDAGRMLRTIVRYQATTRGRDTLPGEIWHEMSTNGGRISPNFAGFLFPGIVRAHWSWAGDRSLLDEMYPHVRALVEWGYLMDTNGDGLLENGPEGEMADSAHEDRNVERSHFHVQTQWLTALMDGIELAEIVGDGASERRWSATRDTLRPVVNTLYWNESTRYFEETLRPDGSLDTSGKGLACLDSRIVDEGKTVVTARLHLDEEAYLTDLAAFRERQAFERTFATHRTFMSWYVIERGRRARELYHAGRPDVAFRALEEIATSPFHWTTPGQWPEVWAVDEPATLRARGCFHQAWTGSFGYIHPVVDGLFGLVPDADAGALALTPRLPPHWPRAALHEVRIGEGRVDIAVDQNAGRRRITVTNNGRRAVSLRLTFVVPPAVRVRRLALGGATADLTKLRPVASPQELLLCADTEAPAGGAGVAELEWVPSDLTLDPGAPRVLDRAHPGETVEVTFGVASISPRRTTGRLVVSLPEGWGAPEPSAPTVVVDPDAAARTVIRVRVPTAAAAGYYTLRARIEGDPGVHVCSTAYLPVFPRVAVAIDARETAREGVPYPLGVRVTNLSRTPARLDVAVEWPGVFGSSPRGGQLTVEAGGQGSLELSGTPASGGEARIPVRVSSSVGQTVEAAHEVTVVPRTTRIVVYSGFLGCPLRSDPEMRVVNLPANYALRKPRVLTQMLATSDLFLTTDQHDGVFSLEQTGEIERWVQGGGKLLLFCAWSAPWGRGFHETFGNVAAGAIPGLLPLVMRKEILHARAVSPTPEGREVFGDVPWATVPPYDHNGADLKPGAVLLAATPEGAPLAARWSVGGGTVICIAIDCFGFESYVEGLSFDWWPGKGVMLGSAVRWILGQGERLSSKPV